MSNLREPAPVIAQIAEHAAQLADADGVPVMSVPNQFGGLDLDTEAGWRVRIVSEDAECGLVELYVLDRAGVVYAQAHITSGFPASAVAGLVHAALTR